MAVPLQRVIQNFNHRIEEPVRKHLRNVYACLTMSVALAAVGAYLNIYLKMLSGIMSSLPALGFLLALHFTHYNGKNNKLRLGYLTGFAFFSGISLQTLINFAIVVNPGIIISALIGTFFIFSCLTACVLFCGRGYWLFLAGPISTLLSALFFLSVGNLFFPSQLIFQINIYVGLLALCGFVIYDTTFIIEKCRMNDKDFIGHSLDLFIDFLGIFKRILLILLEKEKRQKNQSKNK